MKGRKQILLTTGKIKLQGLECPACRSKCDGYTGLSTDLNDPATMPTPGQITICSYCGALLVFVQSFASYRSVSLRMATKREEKEIRANPVWAGVWEATLRMIVAHGRKGGRG